MTQKLSNYITVDNRVRFGKPVIKGTRVPIDLILGKIAGGMKTEDVMREYGVTQEQIRAVLGYAAEIIGSEEIAFV